MSTKRLKREHKERYTKVVEIDGECVRKKKRNYVPLKQWAKNTEEGKRWLKRKKM